MKRNLLSFRGHIPRATRPHRKIVTELWRVRSRAHYLAQYFAQYCRLATRATRAILSWSDIINILQVLLSNNSTAVSICPRVAGAAEPGPGARASRVPPKSWSSRKRKGWPWRLTVGPWNSTPRQGSGRGWLIGPERSAGADTVAWANRLADCDFSLAALHPAYPIKRRTSAQTTKAAESVDIPKRLPPLTP
jgi:hypothetical protein